MAIPRHPIIDVTPIEAVRGAAAKTAEAASGAAEAFVPPSFGKRGKPVENEPLHTTFVDGFGNPVKEKDGGRLAGAVQTMAGAAVMAVGIPMLVLPGPGALATAAGAAIAAGGVKKMRGRR